MTELHRAIFLDRDGVLIRVKLRDRRPYAVTAGDPIEIIPGVPEACAALKAMGYHLVMITNQPDVANGRTPRRFVEETNAWLAHDLMLDDVHVCWHDDSANCPCRKPKPGMILDAARDLGIDLARSILVGDRWRDIEAGKAAGCRTVLVDYHYNERKPPPPDHRVRSLADAVAWIRALEPDSTGL